MKTSLPFSFALLLSAIAFVSTVQPISALSIQVDPDGTISFFDDSVLGETTLAQQGQKFETTPRSTDQMPANANRDREIRVSPMNKERTKIEVQEKNGTQDPTVLTTREAERLEMVFPDETSEERRQQRIIDRERTNAKEEAKELNAENRELFMEQKEEQLQQKLEQRQTELEIRRQQTAERQEARVTLRDQIRDNRRELELESESGAKTRLRGAEFVVNPDDGSVTVVTPSGQEHLLKYFPDEAVAAIQARGFELGNGVDAEIEIDNSGELKQRIKDVKQTRTYFGVLRREITGDAIINDATGEVEFEAELTPLDRFLSRFSRE